jgi:predicted MPP superfamily phosphohydrolase
VRLRVLEVPVPGLPPELEGLRIAHLSDFHLGVPSRGLRAVRRAVDWVAVRKPDLVCITGDLLSRAGGQAELDRLLAKLPHPYVVLGNHDFAISRDPFSQPVEIVELTHGTLLSDSAVELNIRGHSVELAGVDPRTWLAHRQVELPDSQAELRILLCHFPAALYRVKAGRFHFALAGHLHGGQIVLPYGFGRLLLAHPTVRHARGLFVRGGTLTHVSPGLGTTFVPLRFFARPEATELVLRST